MLLFYSEKKSIKNFLNLPKSISNLNMLIIKCTFLKSHLHDVSWVYSLYYIL